MFAVLGEDSSDVDALAILIKRISGIDNQKILRKGFGGCGALRRKACRIIQEFSMKGADRFIVCHDSDGLDVASLKAAMRTALSGRPLRGIR